MSGGDMADKQVFRMTADELLQELDASLDGLSEQEVKKRLEEYGSNEIQTEEKTQWHEILLRQFINPLILVLIAAAVVAWLIGETIEAVVIGVIILVNAAIGFFQEFKAESSLEALRQQTAPEAEVLRYNPDQDESSEESVESSRIVPGDIIYLDAGDRVPADARIFEARNLEIDEAMLTGESVPVQKQVDPIDEEELPVAEWVNVAFGGTSVTSGRGKAIVFATGGSTELGKIAGLIEETEAVETPLQRETARLSRWLAYWAAGLSLTVLAVGLLRGFEFGEIFLFALTAAISSIPAGLPALLTITLAVGVNRMANRKAIIRRLPAVDTLGAANVICSDKTGTLTSNQMTLQQIWSAGRVVKITGVGFEPSGEFEIDGEAVDPQEDEQLRLVLEIGSLCNDSRLSHHQEDGRDVWDIRGDPTEGALVVAAAKAGLRKDKLHDRYPRQDEIPFSSEKKFMATFHDRPEDGARVFLKGAPGTVLERCSHILEDGEVVELEDGRRDEIRQINEDMAAQALRVLGVSYQDIQPNEIDRYREAMDKGEQRLVFAGLVGMIDPPRKESIEAVAISKEAGVLVMMITGDQVLTGEAIAREVGIKDNGGEVISGRDMDRLSEEELDETVRKTRVFARVSPQHKHRIVDSLQRQGAVVAMTGDGVNDAPALQASAVGVAMGITGTDVTREAAEMVITDDNFASIVAAVEEGRVVFQNLRKVIKFLITTNIGESLTILGALLTLPVGVLILTPVQILWINLVTDGLVDVAIALEPKEGDVMKNPPRRKNAPILNRNIAFEIGFIAVIMALGTLFLFNRALDMTGNIVFAQTTAFLTMAMFQVWNSLNVRSRTQSLFQLGLFTNKWLVIAIVVSVLLLVIATLVPFLQTALSTQALPLSEWGIILLVTSSVFIADEIRKLLVRREILSMKDNDHQRVFEGTD
jgi:P-type Ca2+ transporter type 2C